MSIEKQVTVSFMMSEEWKIKMEKIAKEDSKSSVSALYRQAVKKFLHSKLNKTKQD